MNDLFQDIKPAQAMQIEVAGFDGHRLELTAPLSPNINDKGTAFAGSLSSLLVLAGWGAITLRLRDAGVPAEVVVSRSETDYKRPVRSDMRAIVALRDDQIKQLISDIADKGRGKIQVQPEVSSDGKLCAVMTADYVAFAG